MMQNTHKDRVKNVQAQVQQVATSGKQIKIYHGSTNSTRPFTRGNLQYVDVSSLDNVLEVNIEEKYILVEPNVSLDKLVDATLAHGLVPPMVAEFPGITVGGAIQGGSAESSSFKHGTFHETCLEYEVILGDGSLITTSLATNADLFHGLSCAFGSLGILTQIKVKLVPATTYVKLTYHRVDSFDSATKAINELCASDADFVDGIMFGKDAGVIMSGEYMNDRDNSPVAHFSRLTDDWFYIHAQNAVREYKEVIPLKDYLFRYDRGAFWMAKYGFAKPFLNRLTRLLFSGIISTRMLYKFLHVSRYAYVYLIQDICLPAKNSVVFLQFADKNYGIYPLWLCPIRPATKDMLSPSALDTDLVINVGIWGDMKPAKQDFTARNRQLEEYVHKRGGRKVLYAHAYYTDQEFWQIYDQSTYELLRKKYKSNVAFANIFHKIHTTPTKVKPSKLRGVKAVFVSPYKS